MPRLKFGDDPAHWRNRAEQMRTLAEGATNPRAKKRMLKMAEEYEKLARRAEKRAAIRPSQYDAQLVRKQNNGRVKRMPRIPNADEFRNGLARLPILTFHPGEIVLA